MHFLGFGLHGLEPTFRWCNGWQRLKNAEVRVNSFRGTGTYLLLHELIDRLFIRFLLIHCSVLVDVGAPLPIGGNIKRDYCPRWLDGSLADPLRRVGGELANRCQKQSELPRKKVTSSLENLPRMDMRFII